MNDSSETDSDISGAEQELALQINTIINESYKAKLLQLKEKAEAIAQAKEEVERANERKAKEKQLSRAVIQKGQFRYDGSSYEEPDTPRKTHTRYQRDMQCCINVAIETAVVHAMP